MAQRSCRYRSCARAGEGAPRGAPVTTKPLSQRRWISRAIRPSASRSLGLMGCGSRRRVGERAASGDMAISRFFSRAVASRKRSVAAMFAPSTPSLASRRRKRISDSPTPPRRTVNVEVTTFPVGNGVPSTVSFSASSASSKRRRALSSGICARRVRGALVSSGRRGEKHAETTANATTGRLGMTR